MNEIELTQCLGRHPITRKHFRGVFARDELPDRNEPNTFLIVNNDVRSEGGTHWLLMFFGNASSPLYFDSYGLPPMFPEFERQLLKNSDSYIYSSQRLQSDSSNVCGHYCIVFATQLCAGHTLQEIRTSFSKTNFTLNDKHVVILFRKLYGFPRVAYKKGTKAPMICECLS